MSAQNTTGYDATAMAAMPARIQTSVASLSDRATRASADVDAGVSTLAAEAAIFAVCEAMRALTAEITLVADNVKAAGSLYASTDDAVRQAIDRAGSER